MNHFRVARLSDNAESPSVFKKKPRLANPGKCYSTLLPLQKTDIGNAPVLRSCSIPNEALYLHFEIAI